MKEIDINGKIYSVQTQLSGIQILDIMALMGKYFVDVEEEEEVEMPPAALRDGMVYMLKNCVEPPITLEQLEDKESPEAVNYAKLAFMLIPMLEQLKDLKKT